jgi:hypothetical protein
MFWRLRSARHGIFRFVVFHWNRSESLDQIAGSWGDMGQVRASVMNIICNQGLWARIHNYSDWRWPLRRGMNLIPYFPMFYAGFVEAIEVLVPFSPNWRRSVIREVLSHFELRMRSRSGRSRNVVNFTISILFHWLSILKLSELRTSLSLTFVVIVAMVCSGNYNMNEWMNESRPRERCPTTPREFTQIGPDQDLVLTILTHYSPRQFALCNLQFPSSKFKCKLPFPDKPPLAFCSQPTFESNELSSRYKIRRTIEKVWFTLEMKKFMFSSHLFTDPINYSSLIGRNDRYPE